ncbi:MAG: thiamine pyrophosphate-dependent enzyme, partial [Sciscionella sp.]
VELPDITRCASVSMAAPDAEVDRALDLILTAARPVVVAGNLAMDATATPLLVEFVELLGAAYHDDNNAVAFPTSHPANLSGDQELLVGDVTDLVVAIDVADPAALLARCVPTTRLVDVSLRHLRYRGWANAGSAPASVDVHVAAEPREGLRQLLTALRRRVSDGTADSVRDGRRHATAIRHKEVRQAQADALQQAWENVPIAPQRMAAEVWDAVRERDWLLVLRNTRSWLDGVWEFDGAGQWLGHSSGGGVGYGPGAMLGGALAARDRGQLAVAIIGDGDLHMGVGALWTAVHYRIPLLVVINNNRSFFNDEQHQRLVATKRGRPVANAWIGMRLTEPEVDFAEVARGYGAWAEGPIETPEQLAPALRRALAQVDDGGVAVIDVRTAPE